MEQARDNEDDGRMTRRACRVLVVVPAYNEEKTIRYTIMSVLGQELGELGTRCSLDLVVVDDASSDSTYTIALNYCRADPRAHCIRLPFRPRYGTASYAVTRVFNYTVKRFSRREKIDYVGLVSADLVLEKQYLRKIVGVLEAAKNRGLRVGAAGGVIVNEPRTRYSPPGAGFVVRYEALVEAGWLRPEPAEDTGLILRLIDKGWKILVVRSAKMYLLRPTGEREGSTRCYLQGIAASYFCSSLPFTLLKTASLAARKKFTCALKFAAGYVKGRNIARKEYCRPKRMLELLRLHTLIEKRQTTNT